MARPSTFSESDVVGRAMELFWAKGYEATSVSDVTGHVGVHPGSLYRVFGDKHGLFLRALACYRDTQTRTLAPLLTQDEPVVPRIRALMLAYLDLAAEQSDPRGCLIANTAGERLPGDTAVAATLAEILSVVEDGFLQGLQHAERRGEIPRGLDLPARAAMLTLFLQGLQVVVKADPDPRRLVGAVDAVLAGLGATGTAPASSPRT